MAHITSQMEAPKGVYSAGTGAVPPASFRRLEDSLVDLPFDQAIQGGDVGLAFFNRGVNSLSASMLYVQPVPISVAQNTSQGLGPPAVTPSSTGVDDAVRQLSATFQRGQDHMSPNDHHAFTGFIRDRCCVDCMYFQSSSSQAPQCCQRHGTFSHLQPR